MPVKLTRPLPLYVMEAPELGRYVAEYEHFQAITVGTWTELYERMREATPDSVVLVSPYEATSSGPSAELFRLLRSFGSVAVLVGVDLSRERVGDVREMIGAGISGIVNLRLDTRPELAARQFYDAVGRPFNPDPAVNKANTAWKL